MVTGKSKNNGGNSVFRSVEDNSAIIVYGGKGGHVGKAGSGGDSPNITTGQYIQVINTVVNQGGNNASGGNGGAAIIDEYGKGGNYGKSGNGGYFSIVKVEPQVNYYTITVNSTSPVDATVVINGSDRSRVSGTGKQSLTVKEGTTVSYTVSKEHYHQVSKSNITVNSDINESITLTRKTATFILNINGNTNNSIIKITGNKQVFVGNEGKTTLNYNNTNYIEVEVYAGTTIEYEVTKAHYSTVEENIEIGDNDETRTANLTAIKYELDNFEPYLRNGRSESKDYNLSLDQQNWTLHIGGFGSGVLYYKADMQVTIDGVNYGTREISDGKSYDISITNKSINKITITVTGRSTVRTYRITDIYIVRND